MGYGSASVCLFTGKSSDVKKKPSGKQKLSRGQGQQVMLLYASKYIVASCWKKRKRFCILGNGFELPAFLINTYTWICQIVRKLVFKIVCKIVFMKKERIWKKKMET